MEIETIITADVCVNHVGKVSTLLKLLDMVTKVQFVTGERVLFKMQKRNPDIYSQELYDSWLLKKRVPYREHKAALEFGLAEYQKLDEECKRGQVEWYASAFDYKSLEFLAGNFPHLRYWKIASPVTAEHPELVRAICSQEGLKFMSTGMCTLEELDKSVNEALKVASYDNLILMQCTSMYPTPNERVNLAMMNTLRERYNLRVGYSAHDAGVPISVSAVALGAVAIERHITLNRAGPSPDDALSLEYRGLETMIKHIQGVEVSIGSPQKQFYDEERQVREKVRTSQ